MGDHFYARLHNKHRSACMFYVMDLKVIAAMHFFANFQSGIDKSF